MSMWVMLGRGKGGDGTNFRPIAGSNGRQLHPSQRSSLGQCLVGVVRSAASCEGLRTGGGII